MWLKGRQVVIVKPQGKVNAVTTIKISRNTREPCYKTEYEEDAYLVGKGYTRDCMNSTIPKNVLGLYVIHFQFIIQGF